MLPCAHVNTGWAVCSLNFLRKKMDAIVHINTDILWDTHTPLNPYIHFIHRMQSSTVTHSRSAAACCDPPPHSNRCLFTTPREVHGPSAHLSYLFIFNRVRKIAGNRHKMGCLAIVPSGQQRRYSAVSSSAH